MIQLHKLDDIVYVTDYVANGSFASLKKNVEYLDSPGYAMLLRCTDNTKNWNGKYKYVSESAFNFLSKSTVLPGDLIIANVGEPGKLFLAPDLGMPMTLGPNSILVRPKDERTDIRYLSMYFESPVGKSQIQKIVTVAAQRKFNKTNFRQLDIPLPDRVEQSQIATLLTSIESLIEIRRSNIKQLDVFLKNIFLDMFGDPVRNEKGWEKKPLSILGSINRGVSKHRPRNAPELLGGKYPLIQTGEVTRAGTYITKYKKTYSKIGLKQSKLWPAGTLCITIAANIAQTSILTFDACFPDSVVGFVADAAESNNLFVHGLFTFFQRILEKNAPQAAQKNINLEILRNLEVPVPPLALQDRFADIVIKVELIRKDYRESLNYLENIYGAVSQKAFKGELDLSRITLNKQNELSEVLAPINLGLPDEVKVSLENLNAFNQSAINIKAMQNAVRIPSLDIPQLDAIKIVTEQMASFRTPLHELNQMTEVSKAMERAQAVMQPLNLKHMEAFTKNTELARKISDSIPKIDFGLLEQHNEVMEKINKSFEPMRRAMSSISFPVKELIHFNRQTFEEFLSTYEHEVLTASTLWQAIQTASFENTPPDFDAFKKWLMNYLEDGRWLEQVYAVESEINNQSTDEKKIA